MKPLPAVACLLSVTLTLLYCAIGVASPAAERSLSGFVNADGQPPNGKDDQTDDSEALRRAIAVGPGVIRIGPGWYRFGEIALPSGVTVIGAGPASIVRLGAGTQIFRQSGVDQWRIRDLVLDGGAKGDWHARKDQGRRGIFVEKCFGFEIRAVTVQNFNGSGIEMTFTSKCCDGGVLDRITATDNYIGIRCPGPASFANRSDGRMNPA